MQRTFTYLPSTSSYEKHELKEKVYLKKFKSSSLLGLQRREVYQFTKERKKEKQMYGLDPSRKNLPQWLEECDQGESTPELVQRINRFIARELKKNDDRLDIYSECFRMLKDHFMDYGNYLYQIHEAYHHCINYLKERIKEERILDRKEEIRKVGDDLAVYEHVFQQNLLIVKRSIEEENQKLESTLEEKNDNIILQKQKLQLLKESEDDLKSELENESVYMQEIYFDSQGHFEKNVLPLKDDLRKFKQKKRDIQWMKERNKVMETDIKSLKSNLIDRKEYQKDTSKLKEIEKEASRLHKLLLKYKLSNRKLRQSIEKLKQHSVHSDDVDIKLQEFKEKITPRPKWQTLKEEIPTFSKILPDYKDDDLDYHIREPDDDDDISTKEVVDMLLEEYQALSTKSHNMAIEIQKNDNELSFLNDAQPVIDDKNPSKYIHGLGNDPSVPIHMRYVGRMRKKFIAKRDCELILEEFWEAREQEVKKHQMKGIPPSGFRDFFMEFIKKKYGVIKSVRAEWTYNIIAAVVREIDDPDCEIFLRIINHELPELAYRDQFNIIEKLEAGIIKLDRQSTGKLKFSKIVKFLKKQFPGKSSENFKVIHSVLKQYGLKTIKYNVLFEETREKTQSLFIEVLREQYLHEVMEFSDEISGAISNLETDEEGLISISDIFTIFKSLDPYKKSQKIDKIINSIISGENMSRDIISERLIPNGQYHTRDGTIDDTKFFVYKSAFLTRLQRGTLQKRSGKKGVKKPKRKRRKKSLKQLRVFPAPLEKSPSKVEIIRGNSVKRFLESRDETLASQIPVETIPFTRDEKNPWNKEAPAQLHAENED